MNIRIISVFFVLFVITGCASQKKIKYLNDNKVQAGLALSNNYENELPELHVNQTQRDTFEVYDFEGRKTIIMNAIRDESGEMVATDIIQAAVVTARFRNVAERKGKVDIRFQIIVPPEMQDSKWQLRFNPEIYVLEDTLQLEPVIITGNEYRARQLKGYERYARFLSTIVSDTTKFINMRDLEIFIKRNIPDLYALKTDSTFISDERYATIYGVSARQAIDHYTSKFKIRLNNRRKARMGKMFNRYVKNPIITDNIRLDTILVNTDGEFVYEYVQPLNTRPKLTKVDVALSGNIFEEETRIYKIPKGEPLTFYISSFSTLLDSSERYLTRIVERRAEANTACWIAFESGKHNVDPAFGNNQNEINRIKGTLDDLLENKEFDLDSIIVTASCSPEGSYLMNTLLSKRRSESVSGYFEQYLKQRRDDLKHEMSYNLDDTFKDDQQERTKPKRIKFISRSNSENWPLFESLVEQDETLSNIQKEAFSNKLQIKDPDARERSLASEPYYRYLRETIYPKLRTVKFDFYLHRKGMIKDTVHTTVLDTTYMRGVQELRDKNYEAALALLLPYNDFNTAVAHIALDHNVSAMTILKRYKPIDKVEYLLAILYSRDGDDQQAVQHYMNAVNLNHSYIFRGNLDPEIAVLIKKYGLNKEDEEIE